MTVAELIDQLTRLDQGALVVLASDGEFNQISPACEEVEPVVYVPYNSYAGEVWGAHDAEAPEGQKAVLIWPIS